MSPNETNAIVRSPQALPEPANSNAGDSSFPKVAVEINFRKRRDVFKIISFLIFVIFPSVFFGYYYFYAASDQFESETRMVVRTIGLRSGSDEDEGSVTILSGGAITQDAHIAANYLKSPDIVRALQDEIDLRALFDHEVIDSWARLSADANIEELHQYWLSQTLVYVDGPSGIIQFSVRAFSPEDALAISEKAIELTSDLVDQLSHKSKNDLLHRAIVEMDNALSDYLQRLQEVRKYQNQSGVLNPVTDAAVATQLAADLYVQKVDAEIQLSILQASGTANSPVATQLQNKIDVLAERIRDERAKMAGEQVDAEELSTVFAKLSELETKRTLAEMIYKSASRNYDAAKSNTQRQSTFLAIFSIPRLATTSTYPDRVSVWLIWVVCCIAMWATLVLIRAGVEDHRS